MLLWRRILQNLQFKRGLPLLLVAIFYLSFRESNVSIIPLMNSVWYSCNSTLSITVTYDVRHLFGRLGIDLKTVTRSCLVLSDSQIFNANINETWEFKWEKMTVASFSGAYKKFSKSNESDSAIFLHCKYCLICVEKLKAVRFHAHLSGRFLHGHVFTVRN